MSAPENPPLFYLRHSEAFDVSPSMDTDITLRDLFAGMAIQAILHKFPSTVDEVENAERMARLGARGAYVWADAMLAERAKPTD